MRSNIKKAMILAAGEGTRLGALTKTCPKCLIEVAGKPMLQHVVEKLIRCGVKSIVINLHYLGEQIEKFVKIKNFFGIEVNFSPEAELLGTGGGVYQARKFLSDVEEFYIYNSDIYCEGDLSKLTSFHKQHKSLASLLVMQRKDSSYLTFNQKMEFQGSMREGEKVGIGGAGITPYGFCGIQVVSSNIFEFMKQEPKNFSLISTYIKAISNKEKIMGCLVEDFWIDMGTIEGLDVLRGRIK